MNRKSKGDNYYPFDILLEYAKGNLCPSKMKEVQNHLSTNPEDWQVVQGLIIFFSQKNEHQLTLEKISDRKKILRFDQSSDNVVHTLASIKEGKGKVISLPLIGTNNEGSKDETSPPNEIISEIFKWKNTIRKFAVASAIASVIFIFSPLKKK